VNVPNSDFITWDEFRSLRDQTIHFMQQNTLDDGEDFFVCDQASTAWQSTGIRGQGGATNRQLGSWAAGM